MARKLISGFKKGTMLDILPIIIILLAVGIGALVGSNILTEFKTKLVDTGEINSTVGQNILTNAESDYPAVFDNVIPFVFIGLMLAMVIGAILIRTQPVFFFISIIMLVIMLIVVPTFSNAYGDVCDKLSSECGNFQKTEFIFNNLPIFLTLVGIITMVVLYAVFKG